MWIITTCSAKGVCSCYKITPCLARRVRFSIQNYFLFGEITPLVAKEVVHVYVNNNNYSLFGKSRQEEYALAIKITRLARGVCFLLYKITPCSARGVCSCYTKLLLFGKWSMFLLYRLTPCLARSTFLLYKITPCSYKKRLVRNEHNHGVVVVCWKAIHHWK